jgi:nitroimidazol reductase NimA-like FMN-containing flavoprotein (pyridoxamine 5'-phosphate oxidase superfamily)
MITRLNEEESFALLRASRLARLACVADDGEPYVVPVNYVCDDVSIIVHSLPGKKIEAMRSRPRVCVQVDEIKDQFNWTSVLAFGTYKEVTGEAARERAMNLLLAALPDLTPVESVIAHDAGAPAPIIFRVLIDRVTGMREG